MTWRRYPEYKDSGVERLGEIPRHWDSKRLKYCVRRINEKVDGSDSPLPYIGLEQIEPWTGRLLPSEEIPTSDGQSSAYRSGDVLFGKLRPYLAKALRAAADGICTGELLVLRPGNVSQDYLFNYLLTREFIETVDSSTYGAKMPRANWEFIGDLPILLPSVSEQRAIASFLDRETGRIDALIAKKERQIELLQEKRAALISHAVTKGLDPDVPMRDSRIEWLGEIPAHWQVLPFKRLGKFQGGAGFPDAEQGIQNEELPFYKVSDMNLEGNEVFMRVHNNSVSRDTAARLGAFVFPPATIIFPKVGAALLLNKRRILMRSSCIDNNTMGFIRSSCDLKWIYYWMCGLDLGELANPGAVPSINRAQVCEIAVPVPPDTEQRAIGLHLSAETDRIDSAVAKVREAIERLREYRTTLISAAVMGKIDVREERCGET